MGDERVTSKAVLLEHIERDWAAINTLLNGLSEGQWISIRNADNWAVKDHVAHLTAWERSVFMLLRGIPPYKGLFVPEDVYRAGDEDAINAIIHRMHLNDPLNLVRTQFASTHQGVLNALVGLSEADLNQPCSYFVPDEDDTPTINIVYGNTAHHYRTHQRWIEDLLAMD